MAPPYSSGLYSVLVPWSGGVCWVLLRPTSEIFAVSLRAPEVAVPSAQCNVSLFVPFALTSSRQAHAFSVVGPTMWNGLPLSQGLLPRVLSDTFYSSLKTVLFSHARVGGSASKP